MAKLNPNIEPDDAIEMLQQMFAENHLTEYEGAFETLLKGYYELCAVNRERLGVKPSGSNPAA